MNFDLSSEGSDADTSETPAEPPPQDGCLMDAWMVVTIAGGVLAGLAAVAVRRRRIADPVAQLADTARLDAVHSLGLTGRSLPELDELARETATTLAAPTAVISLLDRDAQYFPGLFGMGGGPSALSRGGLAYDLSYCKYVLARDAVLEVGDTLASPLLRRHRVTTERGVRAYLGAPIRTDDGHVVGVCCVYDSFVRKWSPADRRAITTLADRAKAAMVAASHHRPALDRSTT